MARTKLAGGDGTHQPRWRRAAVSWRAVMTNDNDDNADDGIFDDTCCEILGASSRVATSLDLDLAFGAVDVNDDLACTSLLSPLSPSPLPSPLLLFLLLLGSPSEIQEFSLS